jgi:hypothetical protein
MSVDLGGPAVEIAIGLAFAFFLLSTLVSAITEGIAWVFKQRAKQLEQGVRGLLGENEIAEEVLGHALVQSDARTPTWKRKKQKPSYISARNFSLALIDTLAKRGAPSNDDLVEVENGATDLGGDAEALEEQLAALFGDPVVTDLKDFRKAAEEWFDDAMDRVSGWYKRRAQAITCVLAVVVAVGLNANAIAIGEQLANDPTVRAAVVSRAEASAGEEKGDAKAAGEKAEKAVEELKALEASLLWPDGFLHGVDLAAAFGLLITAIAISLGAPFWFDALGKLAHLRTTGKKPDPKTEGAG